MKAPTLEQCKAFGEYVCDAHSWYKHLPLFGGAKFYFFLSENAGAGYTDEKPRMHYGWQTSREYRERFGALDYVYELEGEFCRDGLQSTIPKLTQNIKQNSILLTAFVSPEVDVISSRLEERQSADIPPAYKNWLNAHVHQSKLWNQLTNEEIKLASQEPPPKNAPKRVLELLAAEERSWQMILPLMENERRRVFKALENLKAMQLANETVWFE